jgi:hypothetical protein
MDQDVDGVGLLYDRDRQAVVNTRARAETEERPRAGQDLNQ